MKDEIKAYPLTKAELVALIRVWISDKNIDVHVTDNYTPNSMSYFRALSVCGIVSHDLFGHIADHFVAMSIADYIIRYWDKKRTLAMERAVVISVLKNEDNVSFIRHYLVDQINLS